MLVHDRTRRAEIEWVGRSKQELLQFPSDVIRELGRALRHIQLGEPADLDVRPMQSVGPGVWEIKDYDERSCYRLMYLAVVNGVIYVLHCFEKSSRKTDRRNISLARARLAMAKQMAQSRRR